MHKPSPPKETPPPACPYPGKSTSQSSKPSTGLSALNPLNLMPFNLSNAPAPAQDTVLPFEREVSTITRGDGSGTKWEYPSPQQMYNAMIRKGHHDTPVDAVESMVMWHNYLNEGAWAEILEWERRFGGGLMNGWRESRKGEQGCMHSAGDGNTSWKSSFQTGQAPPEPELVSLTGRPGELTPRARMLQIAGWVFPNTFGGEPPFDRHDWMVKRTKTDGSSAEVRYVIDYYEAPPEPNGDPAFYLDVRPAVDTPEAAASRLVRWGRDVWYRGMGLEVRDQKKSDQQK
jgi:cytochrome c heme-lyase